MRIERSTLTWITTVALAAGAVAAWSALRHSGDAATIGALAFAATSMTLGKLTGASAVAVLVSSALLAVAGVLLLAGLAIARAAGSDISLTTD
ncbi:hypothetical protein [Streptomyces sp. BPTC-684]|uniref:hypothetical protein n=1 Tax=Streptomyces sp. BPTC-684 TaxID=3043734 RepID=UPI0024B05973|nr:hypothetical protein [Streptomyces sp. BPTC-684]WHM41098.1 hypothetical protein QIY60_32410 [Streptomyces sp. BPTC-684]